MLYSPEIGREIFSAFQARGWDVYRGSVQDFLSRIIKADPVQTIESDITYAFLPKIDNIEHRRELLEKREKIKEQIGSSNPTIRVCDQNMPISRLAIRPDRLLIFPIEKTTLSMYRMDYEIFMHQLHTIADITDIGSKQASPKDRVA